MRDRGSIATEVVLLTPVLVSLFLLVVWLGRAGEVVVAVRHAADQGARAASLVRSDAMDATARDAVLRDLATNAVSCRSPLVDVDRTSVGELQAVRVSVTCTVSQRGISLLGVGVRTVRASSTEVVDRYRADT